MNIKEAFRVAAFWDALKRFPTYGSMEVYFDLGLLSYLKKT